MSDYKSLIQHKANSPNAMDAVEQAAANHPNGGVDG